MESLDELSRHFIEKIHPVLVEKYDRGFCNLVAVVSEGAKTSIENTEMKADGFAKPLRFATQRVKKAISQSLKNRPYIFTGSMVEGAALSRAFHPDLMKQDKIELEFDLQVILGTLSKEQESQLDNVEDCPGFFRVAYSEDLELYTNKNFMPKEHTIIVKNGIAYLNAAAFRKTLEEQLEKLPREHEQLQVVSDQLTKIDIRKNIEGPSASLSFTQKIVEQRENKDLFINYLTAVNKTIDNKKQAQKMLISNIFDEWQTVKTVSEQTAETDKKSLTISHDEINGTCKVIEWLDKYKTMLNDRTNFIEFCNKVQSYYQQENLDSLLTELSLKDTVVECLPVIIETLRNEITSGHTDKITGACEIILAQEISFIEFAKGWEKALDNLTNNFAVGFDKVSKMFKQKEDEITGETKPAYTQLELKVDDVPCLFCPFWPEISGSWVYRSRCWPDETVIEEVISSGCHMVPKTSPGGDETVEWRWSFSLAEYIIASKRSPAQRYCYFLFKSLFYKYLKFEMDNKHLTSYIVKTVMLWECERHPPEWWIMDTIATNIIVLLEALKTAIDETYLPHYFIDKLNILQDFPKELLTATSQKLSLILQEPWRYLKIEQLEADKMRSLFDQIDLQIESSQNEMVLEHMSQEKLRLISIYVKLKEIARSQVLMTYYYYLRQYVGLTFQIEMHTTVMTLYELNKDKWSMEKQKKSSKDEGHNTGASIDGKTAPSATLDLKSFLFDENKKSVEAKSLERDNTEWCIRNVIPQIASILDFECTTCDSCHDFIPHLQPKYRCLNDVCFTSGGYDICEKCSTENENVEVSDAERNRITIASHNKDHILVKTAECYPSCPHIFPNHKMLSKKTEFFTAAFHNVSCHMLEGYKELGETFVEIDKSPGSVLESLESFEHIKDLCKQYAKPMVHVAASFTPNQETSMAEALQIPKESPSTQVGNRDSTHDIEKEEIGTAHHFRKVIDNIKKELHSVYGVDVK